MPKFEKGNKLGGRKKGSLNRSTEMAKLTLARLADRGLNNINEDLDKMQVSGEVNHKVDQIKVEVVEKVKEIDIDATEYKDK